MTGSRHAPSPGTPPPGSPDMHRPHRTSNTGALTLRPPTVHRAT